MKTTFSSSSPRVSAINADAAGKPAPAVAAAAASPQSTASEWARHIGAGAFAARPAPTGTPSWWKESSSARTRTAALSGSSAPSEVVTASTSTSRLPSSMQRVRRSSAAPSVSMTAWKRALPECVWQGARRTDRMTASRPRRKKYGRIVMVSDRIQKLTFMPPSAVAFGMGNPALIS